MKLLLDTHVVLWWAEGSRKLGTRAAELIVKPDSSLYLSAASWWEIGIKSSLGRLRINFGATRAALTARGVAPLLVTLDHAEAAAGLPRHHGDPFDRMLVAQAEYEGLTLLTRDKHLRAYGSTVLCI